MMRIKNSFATLLTLTLSLTTPLAGELDTDWLNIARKATRHDWDGGFTQKDIANLNENDRVYLQTEITRLNKKTGKQETVPLYARGIISKKDATKNSLEVVYKSEHFTSEQTTEGFIKGNTINLKQVSKPHFRKLIMLVDNGGEKSAGAVTLEFITAIHQRAAPILVSGNIIRNYLDIEHGSQAFKQYASSLKYFNLLEWVICQKGRFFLLIPISIIPLSIQKDIPAISKYFGLYLEPETKEDTTVDKKIAPLDKAITTKTNNEAQQKEWLNQLSTIEVRDIDFTQEIQPFFREKTFIKIEKEKMVEDSSWIIYVFGHGLPNKFIAGFSIGEFKKFLDFISSKLRMSFLYYSSCYAGGSNLDIVQQAFAKNFDDFKLRNLSFTIAAGSLTEETTVTTTAINATGRIILPARNQGGTVKTEGVNFILFFKNAIDYLTSDISTLKGKDPLKTLYEFVVLEEKSNIPNIYIPDTGYQKTIQHGALFPITKTVIAAKIHPQLQTFAQGPMPDPTINVGNRYAVLYENTIPVPLKIDSGVFIPKGREKIYSFEEIITNNSADLFLNTPFIEKPIELETVDRFLQKLNMRSFIIKCKRLIFETPYGKIQISNVFWRTGDFLLFTYNGKEHAIDLRAPLATWLKDLAWTSSIIAPKPTNFQTASIFIYYATKKENQIPQQELNERFRGTEKHLAKESTDVLFKKIEMIYESMKQQDAINSTYVCITPKSHRYSKNAHRC